MTRRQAAFCMGYFHGNESKTTLTPSEVERRWPHLNKWEVEAYCGGRVAGQGGREDLLPIRQFDINQVSRMLRETPSITTYVLCRCSACGLEEVYILSEAIGDTFHLGCGGKFVQVDNHAH